MLNDEICWDAVARKDKTQDGAFFFGVVTTGVYCRPSCPSRMPLRKNVRFYETADDAEGDGLRPCLRCRPRAKAGTDPHAERIHALCEYMHEHSDEPLRLGELSRRAGLSPFHLQRRFKAITGVTPKEYAEACRVAALKGQLRVRGSVTEAIYEAGFGSGSRVYERVDTRLGMTPAEYRAGGKGVSISYVAVESPVGLMMVGATDRGLCFVQFGDSESALRESLRKEYPAASVKAMARPYPEQFRLWMEALTRHLEGAQPRLDVPVDVRATAFQMKVWRYLQSIPYGGVRSYSEVAAGIGQPSATRAVARACASNQVAIVIPCHRVIRGDGGLGGYRWGLERKRGLLKREGGLHAAQMGKGSRSGDD
jgi:AraC family transcriptional regulator, regulatory protein of adaptative response / methylated-DNA-[protein]-cysteine methyltransferase